MAEDKHNDKDEDFSKTTPAEVVLIVEECKDSVTIAEWACQAIANFTKTAVLNRNREALAQLLDEGICECLISVMHTHCAGSMAVATHGCIALQDLAKSDRELREFLGDLGACELCVFAMKMHVGHPEVTEPGSATMIYLCTDNIRNSLRLSQAGACDILVQAGNFGFNLRHPKCAAIAANICDAISHLCEAANQSKLQESGACELIVALLKFHIDNDQVCQPATRAFCGLASLTPENREELGKAGGCLLIVQAIKESNNIAIIDNCAEAIMHMALSVSNTERLTHAGACIVLMNALDEHLLDRNFGAEICCGALMNMVTYGTSGKENIDIMREAGILELMGKVQISTRSSYRARDNASQLVSYVKASGSTGIHRSSSSPLLVGKSTPLPGVQEFQSTLPSSTNSSPSQRKQSQQSPFLLSLNSFAERGRKSLSNLSNSAMEKSSSPLTIFNSFFDGKSFNRGKADQYEDKNGLKSVIEEDIVHTSGTANLAMNDDASNFPLTHSIDTERDDATYEI